MVGMVGQLTVIACVMRIDLPDAELDVFPGWLCASEADALLNTLLQQVHWQTHRIRMFGRVVDCPRLSSWIGDPEVSYRYSGTRFEPDPWLPVLVSLRQRLRQFAGANFNSVLLNRYRNGHDAMGWHSDDERELGREPVIASLSIGTPRRFAFRRRDDPSRRLTLNLGHGDLLLMAGQTQQHYHHALPRTTKPVGERVNLTYRYIHG